MKNKVSLLLVTFFLLSVYIHHSLAIGDNDVTPGIAQKFLSSFSFKDPFYPDAGSSAVPGWEVRGSTVVMTDFIRLTPAETGRSGYITNRRPFFLNSVNLTLAFHIHSSARFGADGMALWMVDAPLKPGICFGASEVWNGLGVIFDTFSNSGKTTLPQIALHANDGTRSYDVNNDGESTLLSKCTADYRNAEISYLNLVYADEYIHVKVDARGDGNWQDCASYVKYKLPVRYFYSISAATGGLSDNHDLKALTVHTMDIKQPLQPAKKPPVGIVPNRPSMSPEEVEKFIQSLPVEIKPADLPDFKKFADGVTREELSAEISRLFPLNEIEPDTADDDEDIMEKVNEIKDNFGHQIFELQNAFKEQISMMKNQIPATVRLYQQLRNEVKQIEGLLSTTLTSAAILHKELLSASMDTNPILKITSLANTLEVQLKQIESKMGALNDVVEQVQSEHQKSKRQLDMGVNQGDNTSIIPGIIFLFVIVSVICGGGYCCLKFLLKPKTRKVAL